MTYILNKHKQYFLQGYKISFKPLFTKQQFNLPQKTLKDFFKLYNSICFVLFCFVLFISCLIFQLKTSP